MLTDRQIVALRWMRDFPSNKAAWRRMNDKFVVRRDAGRNIETIWSRLKKVEAKITKLRVWAI